MKRDIVQVIESTENRNFAKPGNTGNEKKFYISILAFQFGIEIFKGSPIFFGDFYFIVFNIIDDRLVILIDQYDNPLLRG